MPPRYHAQPFSEGAADPRTASGHKAHEAHCWLEWPPDFCSIHRCQIEPSAWFAKRLDQCDAEGRVFPKGEAYIQSGPILPVSQALEAPWPRGSTHKFRLLNDQMAVRKFEGGTFRLASVVPMRHARLLNC